VAEKGEILHGGSSSEILLRRHGDEVANTTIDFISTQKKNTCQHSIIQIFHSP
jgi:hypothetical protein